MFCLLHSSKHASCTKSQTQTLHLRSKKKIQILFIWVCKGTELATRVAQPPSAKKVSGTTCQSKHTCKRWQNILLSAEQHNFKSLTWKTIFFVTFISLWDKISPYPWLRTIPTIKNEGCPKLHQENINMQFKHKVNQQLKTQRNNPPDWPEHIFKHLHNSMVASTDK